jgi:hypothetical protein
MNKHNQRGHILPSLPLSIANIVHQFSTPASLALVDGVVSWKPIQAKTTIQGFNDEPTLEEKVSRQFLILIAM